MSSRNAIIQQLTWIEDPKVLDQIQQILAGTPSPLDSLMERVKQAQSVETAMAATIASLENGLKTERTTVAKLVREVERLRQEEQEARAYGEACANLGLNIADTLRVRGFGPLDDKGRHLSLDERVIKMAQALDQARTELANYKQADEHGKEI